MHIDIFNGDADGILSLHQYRLKYPKEAILITGVKRDVSLLRYVREKKNVKITVFDISMEKNISDLQRCLLNLSEVVWFDHHRPGEIPEHKKLTTYINTSPKVCTAILVNQYLKGEYRNWTIAAAFGDNLKEQANDLGKDLELDQLGLLQELGEAINYNGYGEVLDDLIVQPKVLFEELKHYKDPFEYMKNSTAIQKIIQQKKMDEKTLSKAETLYDSDIGKAVLLPDDPASMRMSGIYSNELVYAESEKAHLILTHLKNQNAYRVSIRAPLDEPRGADQLAGLFPGGGGRSKAAGINSLQKEELKQLFEAFEKTFGGQSRF